VSCRVVTTWSRTEHRTENKVQAQHYKITTRKWLREIWKPTNSDSLSSCFTPAVCRLTEENPEINWIWGTKMRWVSHFLSADLGVLIFLFSRSRSWNLSRSVFGVELRDDDDAEIKNNCGRSQLSDRDEHLRHSLMKINVEDESLSWTSDKAEAVWMQWWRAEEQNLSPSQAEQV